MNGRQGDLRLASALPAAIPREPTGGGGAPRPGLRRGRPRGIRDVFS